MVVLPLRRILFIEVIMCVPAFFILVILTCIVTGSSVDPDDNRLLKSKE